MFVDASALTAMLTDEADARLLAARLQGAAKRLTSPLAVVDTALAVTALLGLPAEESEGAVMRFLELMGIQVMSLPAPIAKLALEAHRRYGPPNPAGLGAAECLAYAAARYFRQALLHKSAGLAATDIQSG